MFENGFKVVGIPKDAIKTTGSVGRLELKEVTELVWEATATVAERPAALPNGRGVGA